jgi:hypothetical protein
MLTKVVRLFSFLNDDHVKIISVPVLSIETEPSEKYTSKSEPFALIVSHSL